jgi:Ser-tRNA(Ala) deacylase AlaX
MRRTVAPPADLARSAQTFLFWRGEESNATTTKNNARDILNRYYDLPEPVTIGDVTYTAIQAQRKVTPSIDEDAVAELLRKKGGERLYDVVFKREVIRVFDEDALFVLLQKGLISEEEMNAFTVEAVSYALTAVKE